MPSSAAAPASPTPETVGLIVEAVHHAEQAHATSCCAVMVSPKVIQREREICKRTQRCHLPSSCGLCQGALGLLEAARGRFARLEQDGELAA